MHAYRQVEGGFQVVDGLEVAETDAAAAVLQERLALAQAAGLEALVLSPEEAEAASPAFVDRGRTKAALLFPSDGTARADILTAHARKEAEKLGAVFIEADVLDVRISEGTVEGVETAAVGIVMSGSSTNFIPSDLVIITTGIWASQTLPKLPVLPVAHPYIHSRPRPALPGPPSPFIRWPEAHVYARDHGDCSGLGSYDHSPIAVDHLGVEAIGEWESSFDGVLDTAYQHIPDGKSMFEGGRAFNGIFSTTPDNLPLLGVDILGVKGLGCAVAIWVTHAAASAELLAGAFTGRGREGDEDLLKALDPARFDGRDHAQMRKESLAAYNDIYNRGEE